MLVAILTVVGYVVLAVGLALFALVTLRRITSSGESRVRIFDTEISIPSTLVVALIGAAFVVLGTFGPTILSSRTQPTASPTASPQPPPPPTTSVEPRTALTVSQPEPGSTVPENGFPVSGRSNLSPADSLWVVYRGITNNNPTFQPQAAPCSISAAGSFSCPTQFVGGPDDAGEDFELLFILADDAAADEFREYEASDPASRDYPGLDALPEGATQIGRVTVTRA